MNLTDLVEALNTRMEREGLSQRALARTLGISQGHLSKVLRGKIVRPRRVVRRIHDPARKATTAAQSRMLRCDPFDGDVEIEAHITATATIGSPAALGMLGAYCSKAGSIAGFHLLLAKEPPGKSLRIKIGDKTLESTRIIVEKAPMGWRVTAPMPGLAALMEVYSHRKQDLHAKIDDTLVTFPAKDGKVVKPWLDAAKSYCPAALKY